MIVTATPTQTPVLAAIHATCFFGRDAWSETDLATLLTSPGIGGLLHADEGFILWRVAADEADLVTLAVIPLARRRGVADALLMAAMDRLTEYGVARLVLEVAPVNQAALGLYRKHGFIAVGTRPRYYPDGGPALLMQRDFA